MEREPQETVDKKAELFLNTVRELIATWKCMRLEIQRAI